MVGLFEIYDRIGQATSEQEWCDTLFGVARSLGYEQTMFAVVPRPGMPLEQAFLRTTYPKIWCERYVERGMVHFDPTVSHCLAHTIPLLWSQKTFSTGVQKQMYEEAHAHGLRTGFTLPMRGALGAVGILCFVTNKTLTRSVRRDLTRSLPELTLLRDIAMESCQPYLDSYVKSTVPTLTPRERECLLWTAAGKSSWDIAQILRCSEATVNFHMSNVRRKLEVSSRRAAAIKALRLGLISVS